jgi:gamma-glutamyl-gamma-aminobutyrate hydrolase PuuD
LKRIAISQRVVELEGRGETCDRLDQNWTVLLETMGFTPIAIPNRLQDPVAYIEALDVDGVILSGGNNIERLLGMGYHDVSDVHRCRDVTEGKLIDHCIARNIPLLGVCRGLQMIVAHFGGKLHPIDGHVRQTHSVNFTDANRLEVKGSFKVNSFHDFGVSIPDLPSELECSALDDNNTVEALSHAKKNLHGIMWHPEREPNMDINNQIFTKIFGGIE